MDLRQYANEFFHKLTQKEVKKLFSQIAQAINYCHENHIMHRDIKMENILVSVDAEGLIYDVKLADFGKAIMFEKQHNLEGMCGTVGYMAPELVTSGCSYNHQVDVWSLGIVFFCLIAGEMPFKGDTM